MPGRTTALRIAYAIQNVGGIDFTKDVGDTAPVKQSLSVLVQNGHFVRCFMLRTRGKVFELAPPAFKTLGEMPHGGASSAPVRALEGTVRRLQKWSRLPYFAAFDTYHFYAACLPRLAEFDLCHEHNGLFCLGAALACRKLGLPYVLTFSADLFLERRLLGKPLKGLHGWVAAAEARFTYRQASAILCVSEAAREHLIARWGVEPEKITVMPNGVDTERFRPVPDDPDGLRQRYGFGGDPVVAFVGGFQPWHGLSLLVESFAMLVQEIPQARLLLVGDGRARPDVEAAVVKYGLKEKVVITGFVPQERIPAFLGISDVTVMPYPNLPEKMWFSPLKMYEYMAAGKAIVASGTGQITEVIKDGYNGVLVEPGNPAQLAQAVQSLLGDPGKRDQLGANARRQAVERHSWQQYGQRLEDVYRRVLEGFATH